MRMWLFEWGAEPILLGQVNVQNVFQKMIQQNFFSETGVKVVSTEEEVLFGRIFSRGCFESSSFRTERTFIFGKFSLESRNFTILDNCEVVSVSYPEVRSE